MTATDDDVRLTILHTSDWHLGRGFGLFGSDDAVKLRRQRFKVVEDIVQLANQRAEVLLVAGDIFDTPVPSDEVWRGLVERLHRLQPRCQAFLLPGNHDPLTSASPFYRSHPMRQELPDNVHVVDADDFVYEWPDKRAVLHAVPVKSKAGAEDPLAQLPDREFGDDRIRIGMAHGQAFSFGDSSLSHPVTPILGERKEFDYIALGDYHEPKCVAESNAHGFGRVQYCGAPEPMTFGEGEAGSVLFVGMRAHGLPPRVESCRLGGYFWRQVTCRSLEELRSLADDTKLDRTVLRLTLEFSVTLAERREVDGLIRKLEGSQVESGRVAILERLVDRISIHDAAYAAPLPANAPPSLHKVQERLQMMLGDPEAADHARAALRHLHSMTTEGT